MPFEKELIPPAGPTTYLEAHRLAAPRIKSGALDGEPPCRWVDHAHAAVLYVSNTTTMMSARTVTFQLVLGSDIVEFTGHDRVFGGTHLTISRVLLPESMNAARGRLVQLIGDAMHSFEKHSREYVFEIEQVDPLGLFLTTSWQVVANPHSALDLRQKKTARDARIKAGWLRLRGRQANPLYSLGLLLACAVLRKFELIGNTAFTVLGLVSSLCVLASFNSAPMRRRISDLVAGRDPSQSYLNVLGNLIGQSMLREVQPYERLHISIETLDTAVPYYEITFANTGWRPVEIFLGETGALDLVAKGFNALDKPGQRRCIGPYNLNEVVQSLGAVRVWCKSSTTRRCRGIPGYPPASGEVEVNLLNINKDRPLDRFRVRCVST